MIKTTKILDIEGTRNGETEKINPMDIDNIKKGTEVPRIAEVTAYVTERNMTTIM